MSIFGRTLLINSSLLTELWFIAQHVPGTSKVFADIDRIVNSYFRTGKRSNSVSLEFGGLGQLDVKAQIKNLLSKWAIRSIGGDTHPWNIFWEHNIDQLKRYLGFPTHPMFLEAA